MVRYFKVSLMLLVAALGSALAQASPIFANCQGCHQPTGMGVPGAFPPLAGRVPEILAAKDGKNYLIAVVLNGLQGEIMAKGQKYNGVMPSFAQLKDEEIAAVLTHIATQWGNKLPQGTNFTAADVKAARGTKLTPAQVAEMRKKLGLK